MKRKCTWRSHWCRPSCKTHQWIFRVQCYFCSWTEMWKWVSQRAFIFFFLLLSEILEDWNEGPNISTWEPSLHRCLQPIKNSQVSRGAFSKTSRHVLSEAYSELFIEGFHGWNPLALWKKDWMWWGAGCMHVCAFRYSGLFFCAHACEFTQLSAQPHLPLAARRCDINCLFGLLHQSGEIFSPIQTFPSSRIRRLCANKSPPEVWTQTTVAASFDEKGCKTKAINHKLWWCNPPEAQV